MHTSTAKLTVSFALTIPFTETNNGIACGILHRRNKNSTIIYNKRRTLAGIMIILKVVPSCTPLPPN